MTVQGNNHKWVTQGFSEPLFSVERDGKILVVIGAQTPDQALGRSEAIRHIVPLPRRELLTARRYESGPVQVPFFANAYFLWLDSLDCSEDSCPICGR